MRDLTRLARETYNEHNDFVESDDGYIESMDFRSFKTPSEWNTKSQNEIMAIAVAHGVTSNPEFIV